MARNPTIVIADDDSDDRFLIKEALLEYSPLISTVEATNGQELLELLKDYETNDTKPHAIILDINMPLMDGVDALAVLRAKRLFPEVPVFVLTTMRNKSRVEESLKYGVQAIHTKPNSHK